MVRHLNKLGGTRSLYRGGGSIGFAGACRSVWLLAPDPTAAESRVLAQVKNNLGPRQPSLAFSLPGAEPASPAAAEGAPPLLTWQGASPFSADDLLGGPSRATEETGELYRAKSFLTAMLKDGPRSTRDLWAHAQIEGLSSSTLSRAREKLCLGIRRTWEGGEFLSYWSLRADEAQGGVSAHEKVEKLSPLMEELRKRTPPATPLDKE